MKKNYIGLIICALICISSFVIIIYFSNQEEEPRLSIKGAEYLGNDEIIGAMRNDYAGIKYIVNADGYSASFVEGDSDNYDMESEEMWFNSMSYTGMADPGNVNCTLKQGEKEFEKIGKLTIQCTYEDKGTIYYLASSKDKDYLVAYSKDNTLVDYIEVENIRAYSDGYGIIAKNNTIAVIEYFDGEYFAIDAESDEEMIHKQNGLTVFSLNSTKLKLEYSVNNYYYNMSHRVFIGSNNKVYIQSLAENSSVDFDVYSNDGHKVIEIYNDENYFIRDHCNDKYGYYLNDLSSFDNYQTSTTEIRNFYVDIETR